MLWLAWTSASARTTTGTTLHDPFQKRHHDLVPSIDSAGPTALAATPGARVVLRQFLTRHPVPASLVARLVRDSALEARLRAEDRSFGYDFVIAGVADG